jgi:hypothetical protein
MTEDFKEKSKTTLSIPQAYVPLLEDIRLLKSDQTNPNRMSLKQHEEVWKSLQKYGWTYPIITNKDGVFADGEQRAEVCMAHQEFFAPVLRLPVSDVDRRMLRQILNKLKGKHNRELDRAEYIRIIEQGEKEPLRALLLSIGERLPDGLIKDSDFSVAIPETYEIIVECKDEVHQRQIFNKLKREGYKLRILTL